MDSHSRRSEQQQARRRAPGVNGPFLLLFVRRRLDDDGYDDDDRCDIYYFFFFFVFFGSSVLFLLSKLLSQLRERAKSFSALVLFEFCRALGRAHTVRPSLTRRHRAPRKRIPPKLPTKTRSRTHTQHNRRWCYWLLI